MKLGDARQNGVAHFGTRNGSASPHPKHGSRHSRRNVDHTATADAAAITVVGVCSRPAADSQPFRGAFWLCEHGSAIWASAAHRGKLWGTPVLPFPFWDAASLPPRFWRLCRCHWLETPKFIDDDDQDMIFGGSDLATCEE